MKKLKMNNTKQVSLIYQILKEVDGGKSKDIQILHQASALNELFQEEIEEGYDYRPAFDEQNTRDVFSLMSSKNSAVMGQERELLDSIYEFDSDEFITNKHWKQNYLEVAYEH